MYKYHNTIRRGAEKLIEGLENIELFLEGDDNWNFHDSEMHSFQWSQEDESLTITIEPIGYNTEIPGDEVGKKPLLTFHFQHVIYYSMEVNVRSDFISGITFEKKKNYLECWFDDTGIQVYCGSIKVDPPVFVEDHKEEHVTYSI